MKYEIIEIQGIDGLERHVRIENEYGECITFPAIDTNPNYIEFKAKLAEEQK